MTSYPLRIVVVVVAIAVVWNAANRLILAPPLGDERPVSPSQRRVTLPLSNADLEKPLVKALDHTRPQGAANAQLPNVVLGGAISKGPPPIPSNKAVAGGIASKLKKLPAEYNKPGTLFLGESTPVQLVIKTDEKQELDPLFKGLEGEIAKTEAQVADVVSAQLTGPPDRLKITLRGDGMRTITSATPILWEWDVNPLKPGRAQVTLEVTSYIKDGKDKDPIQIRVLQDTWEVDAHALDWIKYQIEQIAPIQAFVVGLGGTIAAVLAWFGIKGFGGKRPDLET